MYVLDKMSKGSKNLFRLDVLDSSPIPWEQFSIHLEGAKKRN